MGDVTACYKRGWGVGGVFLLSVIKQDIILDMKYHLKRVDDWRLEIPAEGEMRVSATIYSSSALALEDSAVGQLRDAACVEPVRRVLATPDIHQGYGVPIGCVMGLAGAVMPAAVGYDINCGMRLLTTGLKVADCDVERLARSVARDVPLGEGKSNLVISDDLFEAICEEGLGAVPYLAECCDHRFVEGYDAGDFEADVERVERRGSLAGKVDTVPDAARRKGREQLGTLGGGNHFIELQRIETVYDKDTAVRLGVVEGELAVMIHSGSRGMGYQVADVYMKAAADAMGAVGSERHLAYLRAGDGVFDDYVRAMHAAGNFAYVNRHIMMLLVRRCFGREFGDISLPLVYDVSHNMAQLEEHCGGDLWVHRKGATRAFGPGRMAGTVFAELGQPVIIPGSMGTASYLLLGTDTNDDTLGSVNHGAGRTMSRTAAVGKRNKRGKVVRPAAITDDQFKRSMKGITLIAGNKAAAKEEAPAAYKDIDAVIEVVCAAKLARPVARMQPLAVLKG